MNSRISAEYVYPTAWDASPYGNVSGLCFAGDVFFLLFLGRIWSLLLILNFFFWNNLFVE